MKHQEAIRILSNMIHDDKAVYGDKPKLRNEALDLAIKALEKNNEILEYMKTCLSQSDELKEKHRNIDDDGLKEYHKRMAIIFEGMGEAYADLIDRFFKEEDDANDK